MGRRGRKGGEGRERERKRIIFLLSVELKKFDLTEQLSPLSEFFYIENGFFFPSQFLFLLRFVESRRFDDNKNKNLIVT